MKTEKKIFHLDGQKYTIVKGKRWYVEYHITHPFNVLERKREYGNINREKDLSKREILAVELIHKIASGHPEKIKSILTRTLQDYKSYFRRKSYQTYESRLKVFLAWLGSRDELLIGLDDANDFLLNLTKLGKHPKTVVSYKRTLCSLYNKANRDVNPFIGAITPKGDSTGLMYFNDNQIKLIKSASPEWLWTAILIEFYCFIRPGEMRLLLIPYFNLEDGFCEIPSEISKNKKTQKVIVPQHLIEHLKKYIENRPNKNGLLFSRDANGRLPFPVNHIYNQHQLVLKDVGIRGRYSFYSWKHTGVVKAVRDGINIKEIQLQLRHHSLDMVDKYLRSLGIIESTKLRRRKTRI